MRIFAALLCALSVAACGSSAEDKAAAAANLSAGQAFLAQNAKKEGVRTTASGLQYRVLKSGPADGRRPKPEDEIKIHYEGKLLSGEVFDSSFERGSPAAFPLGSLIPGWIEGLQLMRPGDEWELVVPPALGYGEEETGPIPGNSVLIFRIQLIDVLPSPGSVQRG
jgi:FKBP-type peptidyl-prolyl cis-trans isomerase